MSLSPFQSKLLELINTQAIDYNNARRAQQKTAIDQELARIAELAANAGGVEDTGQIPSAPTGVIVVPLRRALRVVWDQPLAEDHVSYSEIRVTNEDTLEETFYFSSVRRITLDQLPAKVPHTVEVRHINIFGRAGEWTVGATGAEPEYTVAELIDFSAAQIAGSLGWDNIDQITDPNKFANQVITAEAFAAQNAAAMNLWVMNAAIQSAMIAELSADKISAGIISAEIAIASSGYIEAGGARLDDTGVQLTDTANPGSPPNEVKGSKITPRGFSGAAMHFWMTGGGSFRGMTLWGSGGGAASEGAVRLVATTNNSGTPTDTASARVYVHSQPGGGIVRIGEDLIGDRDITALRNMQVNGTRLTLASGARLELNGGGNIDIGNGDASRILAGGADGVRIQNTFRKQFTQTAGTVANHTTSRTNDTGAISVYAVNPSNTSQWFTAGGTVVWVNDNGTVRIDAPTGVARRIRMTSD